MRNPSWSGIAAVVGVLALIPSVIAGVVWLSEDDLRLQPLPVAFAVGQVSAPTYVIPRPLVGIPRPPVATLADGRALAPWAEGMGGIRADEMVVGFLARSDAKSPVVLADMRVEVLRRDPPVAGTHVRPNGADIGPARVAYVNLDADPPTIRKRGWDFPLSVSSEELETFSVISSTTACSCEWQIVLDFIDGNGDIQSAVANDAGRPFRLTASSAATETATAPRTEASPWP